MTNRIYIIVISLFLTGVLTGCGSGDQQEQETAQKQDAQQKQQQMQQQKTKQDTAPSPTKAEMEAKKRVEEEAAKKQKEQKKEKKKSEVTLSDFSFNPDGAFAVQVEAWRSKEKAQTRADVWKQRGFKNAFVVKYGKEETGNIWYRVRLGKVNSFAMAKKLSTFIKNSYKEKTWIVESSS